MKSSCRKKAGTYALRAISVLSLISACYGQNFTLAAAPSSLTIYPGQQGVPVTISASGNPHTGPISITLTGLPSGIGVSPLTLTTGTSGTLTLSASLSAGQQGFSPTGPSMTTSWTAPVTVVGAAGSVQATAQFSLTVSISNPSFAPAASAINLPIVNINTNGVAIVSKTVDVPGTISITSADGKTSYLPSASDGDDTATFHVHGTSTAQMPKLPYHVKLNTSVDLLNTMGLQCPYVTNGKGKPTCDKSKSYILLANYDDKTFLRDWSASALANAIPIGNGYLNSPADSPTPSGTNVLMPWASHSLFVELYLNGAYQGNYQLIEEVKVDSHRVNINELSETDTAPTQVTGGYLMEIDWHQDEAYVFFTPQNLPIGLIDPDFSPDPEVPQQTAYIANYVDAAETALFSSNFTDPKQGWRAYFDEASAINYYIVNEVMGNVDGGEFYSSVYLYKDENNPLIYMGPVWDFDISSGNVNYATIVNPTVPWMQTQAIWYRQWFQDPGFQADVVTQWNTLKKNGVFTAWLASIQQEAESLEQSQVNNFGCWPMLGIQVWPNTEAAGSYDGEVQYLINWLNLRIAYLDSLFNAKAQTSTTLGVAAGPLRSGSPVTLTAQVTGSSTTPTGTVSFLSNGILLGTGPLTSSGAASLTVSNLPVGSDSLQAVYSGDNVNAPSLSAAQAATVAAPLASTVTSIAGPFATATRGASPGFFTVSVIGNSGTAVPTGTVTFTVDLGSGTAVALDGTGQARYYANSLSSGAHTITASYSGDANYSASSGPPLVFLGSRPPCRGKSGCADR
ncbi:MAG: CotH kinase family protein [Bryobacteraceae bacterium]